MATKNDLIEAQSFSRRRLLTAFVSGAPGGKELEPAKPLRAVIAAIALTVAVILAGVFSGVLNPGLPKGWDNGRLVLAKDTGARYVTVKGVLHPVINTASARLLIPSGDFTLVSVDSHMLAGVKVGSTLGIVGAPDSLPAPGALIAEGWTACVTDESSTDVRVGGDTTAKATEGGVVIESEGTRYVVQGERRYAVAAGQSDAVLRAAGFASLDPLPVPSTWLNLFTPGTPLAPIGVGAGAGGAVPGTNLKIGDVVHIASSPDDERFLLDAKGELVALSPLAWQLYQLGSGVNSKAVVEVRAADVSALPTAAQPAGGADWPRSTFTAINASQRTCAKLAADAKGTHTVLATQPAARAVSAGVHVAAGHGALVRSGGRGEQNSGIVTLVDATGTAYALPGATAETIKRLGYGTSDVGEAYEGWIRLFASGPALTEAAAGQTPGSASGG